MESSALPKRRVDSCVRAVVAQLGYNGFMATNAVVRSRIDAGVKDRAAAVLGHGLTVSDAIRIVLTRVANENELPST